MRKVEGRNHPGLKKLLYTLGFLTLVMLACKSTSSFENKVPENNSVLTNPLGTNVFECGQTKLYYNDDLRLTEDPTCITELRDDGYLNKATERIILNKTHNTTILEIITIIYSDAPQAQIEVIIGSNDNESVNSAYTPNCNTNFTDGYNANLPSLGFTKFNIPPREQLEISCTFKQFPNFQSNEWETTTEQRFNIIRPLPVMPTLEIAPTLPLENG